VHCTRVLISVLTAYFYSQKYKGIIFYLKLSVCLHSFLMMPLTLLKKHESTKDFDEIKCSSSGNSKFVVANCYVLSFVLYKALKALVLRKS